MLKYRGRYRGGTWDNSLIIKGTINDDDVNNSCQCTYV